MAKINPLRFEVSMEPVNQAGEERGPVGSALLHTREQVQELRLHVSQLAAAHGPALVAVLLDHVADVELRILGAERTLATEFGGIQRHLERSVLDHRALMRDAADLADALAEALAELERRDRRSGRKPSRPAAKARKVLDQHNLDRGA